MLLKNLAQVNALQKSKKNCMADLREACRGLLAFKSEADKACSIGNDADSSPRPSSLTDMGDQSHASSELERLRMELAEEKDKWRIHKKLQIAEQWEDMAMALLEGKETRGARGTNTAGLDAGRIGAEEKEGNLSSVQVWYIHARMEHRNRLLKDIPMHACMHTHTCTHTHTHTHKHTVTDTHTHEHQLVTEGLHNHALLHTYIHTYTHMYLREHIHTYIHTYIHQLHINTCLHACIRKYMLTHVHTHIPKHNVV
jgi:hypothetical protein